MNTPAKINIYSKNPSCSIKLFAFEIARLNCRRIIKFEKYGSDSPENSPSPSSSETIIPRLVATYFTESPFFLACLVSPQLQMRSSYAPLLSPRNIVSIKCRYSSRARTNEHRFRSLKILFFSFFDIVDGDSSVAIETFSFIAIKQSFLSIRGKKEYFLFSRILASNELSRFITLAYIRMYASAI